MKGLEYSPPRPPRIRQCGNPDCRICRREREGPPPVTHDDSIAELLLGAAAIALLFVAAFLLIPVLAS